MGQGDIAQRARDLQKLLGQAQRGAPPVPSLKGQPFALASPDEWATAWAESEVAILTVTVDAFRKWAPLWVLGQLPISSGRVSGAPGCVQGPPPLILPSMLASPLLPRRPEARQYCEKAAGIIDAWLGRVRDTINVPNLLWFPTFVMHPGPIAPPTPCGPARLSDMTRSSAGQLVPAPLAEDLYRKATTPGWAKHFGDNKGDLGRIVSDRIAKDLAGYVQQVFQMALVQGVMGLGTVVGYYPPTVQVGHVDGNTLPAVGFLRGVEAAVSPLLTRH